MRIKEAVSNFLFGEHLTEGETNRLRSAINLNIRQDGFNPSHFGEIYIGKNVIKQGKPTEVSTDGIYFKDGVYYSGVIDDNNHVIVNRYSGLYNPK